MPGRFAPVPPGTGRGGSWKVTICLRELLPGPLPGTAGGGEHPGWRGNPTLDHCNTHHAKGRRG